MRNYRKAFILAAFGNLVLAGALAGIWWHGHAFIGTATADAFSASAAEARQATSNSSGLPPAPAATPLALIQLSPERLQSIGVQYARVKRMPVQDEIRVTGNVAIDETRLSYVQTRFSGYIEKVFADATYKYVRKGQPLFTIYSPELAAAEREYLVAKQDAENASKSTVPGVATGFASLVGRFGGPTQAVEHPAAGNRAPGIIRPSTARNSKSIRLSPATSPSEMRCRT